MKVYVYPCNWDLIELIFSRGFNGIIITITYKTFKSNVLLLRNSIYTQNSSKLVTSLCWKSPSIIYENELSRLYIIYKKREKQRKEKKDRNKHPHIIRKLICLVKDKYIISVQILAAIIHSRFFIVEPAYFYSIKMNSLFSLVIPNILSKCVRNFSNYFRKFNQLKNKGTVSVEARLYIKSELCMYIHTYTRHDKCTVKILPEFGALVSFTYIRANT